MAARDCFSPAGHDWKFTTGGHGVWCTRCWVVRGCGTPPKRKSATPNGLKNAARKRAVLLERDGDLCCLCGQPFGEEVPTVEHVVPLSRGGGNGLSNLKLSHYRCNHARGDAPWRADAQAFA